MTVGPVRFVSSMKFGTLQFGGFAWLMPLAPLCYTGPAMLHGPRSAPRAPLCCGPEDGERAALLCCGPEDGERAGLREPEPERRRLPSREHLCAAAGQASVAHTEVYQAFHISHYSQSQFLLCSRGDGKYHVKKCHDNCYYTHHVFLKN